jgi:eukaryotic-like serine/threonine-protein kinase
VTPAKLLPRKRYEGLKQRQKTIPPQGQIRLVEAVEQLMQLYEATDRKTQAAQWRKELEGRKGQEKDSKK